MGDPRVPTFQGLAMRLVPPMGVILVTSLVVSVLIVIGLAFLPVLHPSEGEPVRLGTFVFLFMLLGTWGAGRGALAVVVTLGLAFGAVCMIQAALLGLLAVATALVSGWRSRG